jgi:hypothetical protein
LAAVVGIVLLVVLAVFELVVVMADCSLGCSGAERPSGMGQADASERR